MSRTRSSILFSLMFVGASMFAYGPAAQEQSPPGRFPDWSMPFMMDMPWGWSFGMEGWGESHMTERIDGRLAYLEAEIGITNDQSPAWNRFAEEVRTSVEAHNSMMRQHWNAADNQTQPAPERISEQIDLMRARLTQLESLQAAVEALYGSLDAEQRREADTLLGVLIAPGYRQVWR